jgi:hypothetical protein
VIFSLFRCCRNCVGTNLLYTLLVAFNSAVRATELS